MSKENETQSTESGTESSTSDTTLDELYGEFSQETQPPQSVQQTTQSDVKPQVSVIPDPVSDPDGFKAYMGNMNNELAAARSSVREAQDKIAKREQELASQAEERDFRNIAEEISKAAEVEPDLVEAVLLHKYVKDKNFQGAWQNRDKNQSAFTKIKSVLAQDMRGRFNVKVDPQLAENQRAAEEATRTSGTKPDEPSPDDKLMQMDGAEFDREMRKIRSSA